MFAEFESAARCTSFQHPQPPQPLYMMSTGPGTYIVPSDFVYGIDDTSLYTFLPWFFAWVTKGWYGSPSKRTPEQFSHGLDTHLVAQPTAKALIPQLSGETCLLNIIFMDLQLAFREGDDSPFMMAFWCHTHTHPFNGPLSGTTQVSRYQKGKTNLDFTKAGDSEWQWHHLGHMQVCTALQTDSHTSTPPLSFLQAGCPSCCPTNSVKALMPVPR